MKEPLFSVIVPIYNPGEMHLTRCVESILDQTFSDCEIVLVDDGSTDESGAICDRYAEQNEGKVRVIHQPNGGVLSARCSGIRKAAGRYIVFCDSDDRLKNNTLEVLREAFERTDADCVVYGFEWIDTARGICRPGGSRVQSEELMTDRKEILLRLFANAGFTSMSMKSFRRSLVSGEDFDISEYFAAQRGEDLIFSIELLKRCDKVLFIPLILYEYYNNENSMTHQTGNLADSIAQEKRVRETVELQLPKDDTERLMRYYISLYLQRLKAIADADLPYKTKAALYDECRRSNICSYFKDRTGESIQLKLLMEKKYFLLYVLIKAVPLYKKVRNKVRK